MTLEVLIIGSCILMGLIMVKRQILLFLILEVEYFDGASNQKIFMLNLYAGNLREGLMNWFYLVSN